MTRSSSGLVGDVSGSLHGEDEEPDLAQAEKDARREKHDFWSISGNYIYRHHVLGREICVFIEKNHSLVRFKHVDGVRHIHKPT